jgi:AraC-like DNA-binding protein
MLNRVPCEQIRQTFLKEINVIANFPLTEAYPILADYSDTLDLTARFGIKMEHLTIDNVSTRGSDFMTKTTNKSESNPDSDSHSASGDVVPFRQLLDELKETIPFAEAIVISSLPRGGLQIVQPAKLSDALVRAYSRDLQAYDRLTWQAIARNAAVRARDVWPAAEFENAKYRSEFMEANGFSYAAAAPLAAPVLEGYPGAVHIYRNAAQGAFTDEDLDQLMRFARKLDDEILSARVLRDGESRQTQALSHQPPVHQFIFDSSLNAPLPQADVSSLDEQLKQNILADARQRLDHVNGSDTPADRVPLADSHGDLWNFRVVTRRNYPALSDGPVIFFCLQPSCHSWSVLRPVDFQADNEVARLIPAMKFMREQYHRGPTLVEIAKTVHLSPFHFHRRFTELLGITPKHFLLDCQIQQAKKDLLEKKKDLVTIATECGFAHQSHFTSRFKQATGLTPTRWRRVAIEAQRAANN